MFSPEPSSSFYINMPDDKTTGQQEDISRATAPQEKGTVSTASEASSPKSGLQLALLLIALSLAVLCQALDNTIITTAIPKITDEFNSVDDVGWYG